MNVESAEPRGRGNICNVYICFLTPCPITLLPSDLSLNNNFVGSETEQSGVDMSDIFYMRLLTIFFDIKHKHSLA